MIFNLEEPLSLHKVMSIVVIAISQVEKSSECKVGRVL